jgi:hypothetical protein
LVSRRDAETLAGGKPVPSKRRCPIVEVQVLIPVRDNEGIPFDPAHDAVFEAYLASHFGGFTRLPAEAGGGWVDKDGTYYPDTMRVYIVAVDGLLASAEALRLMGNIVKAHYRQKAVFLRYLGQAEVL